MSQVDWMHFGCQRCDIKGESLSFFVADIIRLGNESQRPFFFHQALVERLQLMLSAKRILEYPSAVPSFQD